MCSAASSIRCLSTTTKITHDTSYIKTTKKHNGTTHHTPPRNVRQNTKSPVRSASGTTTPYTCSFSALLPGCTPHDHSTIYSIQIAPWSKHVRTRQVKIPGTPQRWYTRSSSVALSYTHFPKLASQLRCHVWPRRPSLHQNVANFLVYQLVAPDDSPS